MVLVSGSLFIILVGTSFQNKFKYYNNVIVHWYTYTKRNWLFVLNKDFSFLTTIWNDIYIIKTTHAYWI